MFRVKISHFIKKHINKIRELGTKLIIVAIVVFIATIMLSINRNSKEDLDNQEKEVYNPTQTIIEGQDISEEQYEKDSNAVDKFLEYCNNGKLEEAYNLISDGCKENLYPSIDIFKENFYNYIFKEKREYNMQSWISTKEYTVYTIRYTNNMIATGKYDENNVYQDYITLFKNSDTEKISIGEFIQQEKCNIVTTTAEIEAKVTKKNIYINNEEYEIYIKNKTSNTILLDSLTDSTNIQIITNASNAYNAYISKIFKNDIIIEPGDTKKVTISFKKPISMNQQSEYIRFLKVIRNYEEYTKDVKKYTDNFIFKIKV